MNSLFNRDGHYTTNLVSCVTLHQGRRDVNVKSESALVPVAGVLKEISAMLEATHVGLWNYIDRTSNQARLPAEFKHIIKRRKRN